MEKNYDCKVIKILREAVISANFVARFQICSWAGGELVLEKRVFRRLGDEWKPCKLRGWNDGDVQLLQERLEEILDILNDPQ